MLSRRSLLLAPLAQAVSQSPIPREVFLKARGNGTAVMADGRHEAVGDSLPHRRGQGT